MSDKKDKNLEYLFNPKTIAVIGASRNYAKPGNIVIKNLLRSRFKGRIFPVNPSADEILGLKCYSNISEIPDSIDMAIVIVPSRIVPDVIESLANKLTKVAIVISAGFREIGNMELEKRLCEAISNTDMRILGPNCLGILDNIVKIDTWFLPEHRMSRPKRGDIALLTQSGSFGAALIDYAAHLQIGLSRVISYGNMNDIDETDILLYLRDDKETKVICMYIEGIKDGREFMQVSREITIKKPIIALKAGRNTTTEKAIQSHTGSLAGDSVIYDAAFRQSGIIRSDDIEELLDYAKALSLQPPAKGNRIGIITDGGGFGILAADSLEDFGLQLAELDDKTVEYIKPHISPNATTTNPIDLTGDANEDMYKICIEAMLRDPNVDGIVIIALMHLETLSSDIVNVMKHINYIKGQKPVVCCSTYGRFSSLYADIFDSVGVPTYPTARRAVRAMSALYQYGVFRDGMLSDAN